MFALQTKDKCEENDNGYKDACGITYTSHGHFQRNLFKILSEAYIYFHSPIYLCVIILRQAWMCFKYCMFSCWIQMTHVCGSLKETSLNARGELLHIIEKPICPSQAVVIAHSQLVQEPKEFMRSIRLIAHQRLCLMLRVVHTGMPTYTAHLTMYY